MTNPTLHVGAASRRVLRVPSLALRSTTPAVLTRNADATSKYGTATKAPLRASDTLLAAACRRLAAAACCCHHWPQCFPVGDCPRRPASQNRALAVSRRSRDGNSSSGTPRHISPSPSRGPSQLAAQRHTAPHAPAADTSGRDSFGQTPLIRAAKGGDTGMIKRLLDQQADVGAQVGWLAGWLAYLLAFCRCSGSICIPCRAHQQLANGWQLVAGQP